MRNLAVFFVILFAGLTFAGCGPSDKDGTRKFEWTTWLVFRYELTETASTINNNDKDAFELEFDADWIVEFDGKLMYIIVPYDDIKTYRYIRDTNAFYRHEYAKFDNPLQSDEVTDLAGTIDLIVRGEESNPFYNKITAKAVKSMFVLDVKTRASTVSGKSSSEMVRDDTTDDELKYRYFIDTNKDIITVHWRFANQPTWYIVAIIGTAIFMGGIYLLLRMKNVKE